MSLGGYGECDWPGCGAQRRTVNHWFVVHKTGKGVHVYRWDDASEKAMNEGKHFCGVTHTIQHVSSLLTADNTDPNRESTLELKPPLTREGTAPEQPTEEKTENKENAE